MSPDNETPTPAQNPTLAEDDKNRRTIEPSEGPNKAGYDNLVKGAHTRDDADGFTPATKVETESAIDSAVRRDVEPSTPAPETPHAPDAPQEG
jgi:hypothetical protein